MSTEQSTHNQNDQQNGHSANNANATQSAYDYLVFIGRFQPFHVGHKFVITEALKRASNVILLIGSANLPRSLRNPFSVEERTQMIKGAFSAADAARIHCVGLDDALYNDNRWLQYVQSAVRSVVPNTAPNTTSDSANQATQASIGLIGHSKDSSSYYLSLFPHWASVAVENYENLSATPIRDAFLAGDDLCSSDHVQHLPESSQEVMAAFQGSADYQRLHQEYQVVQDYQQQWQDVPYPPTFVTADALVIQSGHILLIERGGNYGQGLWALPGGFIDPKETLADACIRELIEETCLQVPEATLKSSRHSQHTFDDPYRSARRSTITQAFYFQLKNDPEGLPAVRGSDDAVRAFWLPLAQLDSKRMFEDHYAIICKMIGL